MYCEITFSSTEHAYQWKRAIDIGSRDVADKILEASDGFLAKRLSNELDKGKVIEWKENNGVKVMKFRKVSSGKSIYRWKNFVKHALNQRMHC